MSNKKTIYIHIGIGRTGTTSIQNSLFQSREKLLELGCLYPLTGLEGAAHHGLAPLDINLPSTSLQMTYTKLIDELGTSNSNGVLLSSEYFSYFNPVAICQLITALMDIGDIKLIFYVRRQGPLFQSAYLQRICYNRYIKSFKEFVGEHLAAFDYSLRLKPWLDCAKDIEVICRSYDHPEVNSNVIDDILKIINLKEKIGSFRLPNERVNESLNYRFAELTRLIATFPITDQDFHKVIKELFAASSFVQSDGATSLYDEETKRLVESYYVIRNAEFSNKFLPAEHRDMLTVW